MRVLDEETWTWMLFSEEKAYFISVVSGSVGIYTRDIELSPSEIEQYKLNGRAYISDLAKQINAHPTDFEPRHITLFEKRASVREAALEWRAKHDQKPT